MKVLLEVREVSLNHKSNMRLEEHVSLIKEVKHSILVVNIGAVQLVANIDSSFSIIGTWYAVHYLAKLSPILSLFASEATIQY
jgi:hypothetical protein